MTSGISRLADARLAAGAAAIAGDAATLYHVVSGLMGDGVPFETVLFDVLVPAEREVGDRWQFGDFLVAEEHAATATLETVVSLMAGAFDRPDDGPFLVVAAVAGDRHSLAGRGVEIGRASWRGRGESSVVAGRVERKIQRLTSV